MQEFWRLEAVEVARGVREGSFSALEVTRSVLDRLDAVNPSINAVVQFMPDQALEAAANVDAAIAKGEVVGPLAGVPVTTKVNVDQAGFATTNGLKLQQDLVATTDNPVVANLKKAGAAVVGRTNTPAFSLHWFTRNQLHGHTRNPHNTALTPGGSSGGGAAATAAGIGAIGHGTDIAGSVRYPAYACGLHGLRPSLGRVPAVNLSSPDRHIGAQLMAVSGPMARSIADIRLGLEAMAQADPSDPWQAPVPLELPKPAERKVAICIAPEGWKVDSSVVSTVERAAKVLKDACWTVDEVELPSVREAARWQAVLWLAEFRRSAAAMIDKEGDPDAIFVYEQMSRLCPPGSLEDLLDALQARVRLARGWNLFFQSWPLVLCPVSSEPPFPDLLDLESPQAFDRVMEAQLLQIAPPFMGLPGLAVTTTVDQNRTPMGVQLLAAQYREDLLLEAGEILAAASPALEPVTPRD
ncbi:MAG: amidase family protein [Pseudomonadota bacterium]